MFSCDDVVLDYANLQYGAGDLYSVLQEQGIVRSMHCDGLLVISFMFVLCTICVVNCTRLY